MQFLNPISNKIISFTALLILVSGCNKDTENTVIDKQIFKDITKVSGLSIEHYNGMDGNLYSAEIMGPASALFDFDNDGDLDIFIGQGNDFITGKKTGNKHTGKLYRNDTLNGEIKFIDVTQDSGLIVANYSMGIAIGDINNDGFADVYLSNYGDNQMFMNQGDGRFLDITASSNTGDDNWSVSSAFFDMDGDNLLDLYVSNYFDFNLSTHKTCFNKTGREEYCGPASYPHLRDSMFKNMGNGVFKNHTIDSKMIKKAAGLGVVTGDFNLDGLQDVYVTNDMGHNFMWINNGDGTFVDDGLLRGNAVNIHGIPEASMGVDAGDFDNDGDLDLFMTHLLNETNTIYQNNGKGFFKDATTSLGLSEPSKGYTGFGTAFLDFDNDGWLDIIAINGEVRKIQEQIDKGSSLPLAQANQLFHNINGKYTDISDKVDIFKIEKVSRGIAIGDIDNDGDTDVLISNNNDAPQLLINQVGNENNWIGLNLIAENGKFILGSTATVSLKNGDTFTRRSHTDASYISANDPRIIVGLNDYNKTVDVTINWADGKTSSIKSLAANKYHEIIYPN